MTLALVHRGIALCATDTRHNFYMDDGTAHRVDSGAKLRPVDGGWVAATGEGIVSELGMQEISRVGLYDADAAEFALRSVGARVSPGIRTLMPGAIDCSAASFPCIRIADGAPVLQRFASDGPADPARPEGYTMSLPPEIADADAIRAHQSGFCRDVARAGRLADVVRAVATAFERSAEEAVSMSGAVEIGWLAPAAGGFVHLYLSAPARWVVRADAASVVGAFRVVRPGSISLSAYSLSASAVAHYAPLAYALTGES
jgi:hypothetical protein